MSHKKQGQLTTSPEWARHLRPLLRRWFWKGERRAAREMLRSGSDQEISDESAVGSVEVLLDKIAQWSEGEVAVDLWVPSELTLEGRAVAHDIAMEIVLEKALSRGVVPNGFSMDNGGRLYHYKSE